MTHRKWSDIRRSKGAGDPNVAALTAQMKEQEAIWQDIVSLFDPPLTDAQESTLLNLLDAVQIGATQGAQDAMRAFRKVVRE